jgi:hypothetical protein
MPQAQSFYDRHSELTWWFVMARIGQGLREEYKLPTEVPPELRALVRKLDKSDLLFPAFSWRNDVDFFP